MYQITVLSLFNDVTIQTYKEIADKTEISKDLLDAALVALCKPGVKILLKETDKKTFDSDAETFTLNMEFKS